MFFVGIDVSKQKLHVALLLDAQRLKKRQKSVPNDAKGYQSLLAWCHKQAQVGAEQLHVVLEATGPYYEGVALALYEAGVRVSVVNPLRVKDYASSLGLKAKNDALDALTLARFGAERQPRLWQPDPPEIRQLQALLRRVEALDKDLRREQNRQEKAHISCASTGVQESLQRSIAFLKEERQTLIQSIDDHIDRHPQLKADRRRLSSIPGVGTVLSAWMLALLHRGEGFEAAPQLASFLGLTPCQHQSGSSIDLPPRLSKAGPAFSGPKSTWPVSRPSPTTPMFATFISACSSGASAKKPPWVGPCANWCTSALGW